MRRNLSVLAGVVGASTLLPASSAFAGQYILGFDRAHGGYELTYQGFTADKAQTETNTVTVTQSAGRVVIHDASAVVGQAKRADGTLRGPSCDQPDANTVVCPKAASNRPINITYLNINVGLGDDTVTNDTGLGSLLLGGPGKDHLIGGQGADTIDGDGDQDVLDGRAGNDVLQTDGTEFDVVACGTGTDTAHIDRFDRVDDVQPPFILNARATSCESVFYEGAAIGDKPPAGPGRPGTGGGPTTPPVTRVPGGARRPPLPGGFRAPRGGCPVAFVGTRRADRFIGNDGGDRMFGRGGADLMFGFAGADCLFGQRGNDRMFGGRGNDLIVGGPGNDVADGGPGNDRIYGQGGRDRLFGGPGRDRIYVGAGRNRVDAGPGRDFVDSRNGKRDVVRCGKGRDTVRADKVDRLIGCERKSKR